MEEEIEELENENCEVESTVRFDLCWTCKNCGNKHNIEYDIQAEETIICECEECGKKYEYYYCPY